METRSFTLQHFSVLLTYQQLLKLSEDVQALLEQSAPGSFEQEFWLELSRCMKVRLGLLSEA